MVYSDNGRAFHIDVAPGEVGKYVLMPGDPKRCAAIAKYFDDPVQIADNVKKAGGVVPGITPGRSTSEYLNKILNYIVFIGAVGLMIVALIPIMCTGFFNASVSFGGTSIIIIVGVVLETMKQIESMMVNRNYRGFLSE